MSQSSDLIKGFSIELTIAEAGAIAHFGDFLPLGTAVFIVSKERTDQPDLLALAARLRQAGMRPVPHVVARHMASAVALDNFLRGLAGVGVTAALVMAGDAARPVGPFSDSLAILQSGMLQTRGIAKIYLTAYPEGHPQISPARLRQSLLKKNEYADSAGAEIEIITQFFSSVASLQSWEKSLAGSNHLSFRAGIAGWGEEIRMNRRARKYGVRIPMDPPDKILADLAAYRQANPDSLLCGAHLFPFGEFTQAATWARNLSD